MSQYTTRVTRIEYVPYDRMGPQNDFPPHLEIPQILMGHIKHAPEYAREVNSLALCDIVGTELRVNPARTRTEKRKLIAHSPLLLSCFEMGTPRLYRRTEKKGSLVYVHLTEEIIEPPSPTDYLPRDIAVLYLKLGPERFRSLLTSQQLGGYGYRVMRKGEITGSFNTSGNHFFLVEELNRIKAGRTPVRL